MTSTRIRSGKGRYSKFSLWIERFTALLALANLGLVLFDLSYIPWRDFWLQGRLQLFGVIGPISIPILSEGTDSSVVTRLYDPVKGIQPNRDTQDYLDLVDQLRQVTLQNGLTSPAASDLLEKLRTRSLDMIDSDPFVLVGKSGTLVKIKNRMRDHVPNPDHSAKESFSQFWSQPYLTQAKPDDGLEFFQRRIRPLMETNYFRPLGESGQFVDYFPALDFPFVLFFGSEFLLRTWMISRRYPTLRWRDAMIWRWYDLLLFIPVWQFLRVIPVVIRLGQAKLIDLDQIQTQINRGFVASIAGDLTEVIVVQVIGQLQASLRRGEILQWLTQIEKGKSPLVDLNNVNEIAEIANLLFKITTYQVLPKIKPDIDALFQHSLSRVVSQLPGMQTVAWIPGLSQLSQQVNQTVVTETTQAAYQAFVASLNDAEGAKLIQQIVQHFSQALVSEIQIRQAPQEIRDLMLDFLEEIKITFIQQLSQENLEDIIEQTRQLQQRTGSVAPDRILPN